MVSKLRIIWKQLDLNDTAQTSISIPSVKSPPLTIESGVWAMWPVDMNLLRKESARESLLYATAQLVARVQLNMSNQVLFLVETQVRPPSRCMHD